MPPFIFLTLKIDGVEALFMTQFIVLILPVKGEEGCRVVMRDSEEGGNVGYDVNEDMRTIVKLLRGVTDYLEVEIPFPND